ncbi:TetR/AcrR family transcriptional regulator [Microlunatus ginsengisoli]|uniref:TetR/AcrR family transcriptional regulator n=1 Tax=Microlunatus ginsengisoli TaxID=363863 RepID=A0ABP6ZMC2_9ACTN
MADTRQRILTAATDLMRSRGYRGTGLKDITTTAVATTGSLYHFFPGGKEELVCAAIRVDGAAHEALFLDLAGQASTPGEAIAAFFSQAADILEATDYVDLCPIGTIAGEIASTSPQIRVACDDVFAGWQRMITTELAEYGLDVGDATELSATVVAALLGGFLFVRTRRCGTPLRDAGHHLRELIDHRLASTRSP